MKVSECKGCPGMEVRKSGKKQHNNYFCLEYPRHLKGWETLTRGKRLDRIKECPKNAI